MTPPSAVVGSASTSTSAPLTPSKPSTQPSSSSVMSARRPKRPFCLAFPPTPSSKQQLQHQKELDDNAIPIARGLGDGIDIARKTQQRRNSIQSTNSPSTPTPPTTTGSQSNSIQPTNESIPLPIPTSTTTTETNTHLHHLRSKIPTTLPPLILIPQLHAHAAENSGTTATTVDRELAKLIRDGVWRKFRIHGGSHGGSDMIHNGVETSLYINSNGNSGAGSVVVASVGSGGGASVGTGGGGNGGLTGCEYSVVNVEQYHEWVITASKKLRESVTGTSSSLNTNGTLEVVRGTGSRGRKVKIDVYERFWKFVMGHPEAVHVSRESLKETVGIGEEDVSELVSAGFLTIKDVRELWLAVPKAGAYVRSFLKGRQDVINILKRKKFKEHLRKAIEERKLRECDLPGELIVLELLGSGMIQPMDTPVGPMLKLTKKADAKEMSRAFKW
ncbi:Serine/threonine-protein kinase 19 [Blyttiomyces sp. JEL0837]|nr:Serine/threonine-protein kinase 19 [Blyttiomyces sp. JEL0837]